jgi:hypothetical protein
MIDCMLKKPNQAFQKRSVVAKINLTQARFSNLANYFLILEIGYFEQQAADRSFRSLKL